MTVLLVFVALVGAYIFGIVSTLGAVKKISLAAWSVLSQEIKWRAAERKARQDREAEP